MTRRVTLLPAVVTAVVAGALSLAAAPASAAALTADPTIADGAAGSLRDVLANQATDPSGDTVTLTAGATYTLDACTGSLDHGDTPLTIVGNGATIDLTCDEQRVLYHGNAPLSIDDLTLVATGAGTPAGLRSGGDTTLTSVRVEGVPNDGISVVGDLTATDVTVTGAASDNGGISVSGGLVALRVDISGFADGIDGRTGVTLTDSSVHANGENGVSAAGPVRIVRSSVVDNTTGVTTLGPTDFITVIDSTIAGNDSSAFPASDGAGIHARSDVLVVNSTISGNSAGDSGGGIYVFGDLTLVHATVMGNSAPMGANLFTGNEGDLESFASVVGDPMGGGENCDEFDDVVSRFDVEGGDDSCEFATSNVATLGLGALAANGGPTRTHLSAATSPLVDAVPAASCGQAAVAAGSPVGADQRGTTRPQRTGCDVGAVEVAAANTPGPNPTPPSPATPSAASPTPRTAPIALPRSPAATAAPATPRLTG